jgi:hypothetical protein
MCAAFENFVDELTVLFADDFDDDFITVNP